jgi:hypothetical protein
MNSNPQRPDQQNQGGGGQGGQQGGGGQQKRVNSPGRAVSSRDNRADSRSRVKAVSRINAKTTHTLVTFPPALPGAFFDSKEHEKVGFCFEHRPVGVLPNNWRLLQKAALRVPSRHPVCPGQILDSRLA